MWQVSFTETKQALRFWFALYKKLGVNWDFLSNALGRPPCKLFRLEGLYLAVIESLNGFMTDDVQALLKFYGAKSIQEPPHGLTKADLAKLLLRVRLVKGGPRSIPEFAIFSAFEQSGMERFARWLMDFGYNDMRFAIWEGEKDLLVWLVAVQGLRSLTPFKRVFRDPVLSNTRVFYPLNRKASVNSPGGYYIEMGYEQPLGKGFSELWSRYGDPMNGHLVLRSCDGFMGPAPARFYPIPKVINIDLDRNLKRFHMHPAESPPALRPIELSVEKLPYEERESSLIEWRQIVEEINLLKSKLDKLKIRIIDERSEALPLVLIPERAEPAFCEVLRQTPDEVLRQFRYFCYVSQGKRTHFILPDAKARKKIFPSVDGGSVLYRKENWYRIGLQVYMAKSLRLSPYLHPSQVKKLRDALLKGMPQKALGDSPLILILKNEDGDICQHVLPDPRSAFILLPDAIAYLNSFKFNDSESNLLDQSIDSFHRSLNDRLTIAKTSFPKNRNIFCTLADGFLDRAIRELNAALPDMEELKRRIKNLENTIQAKKGEVSRVNEDIDNLFAGHFGTWERRREALEKLKKDIDSIFKSRRDREK